MEDLNCECECLQILPKEEAVKLEVDAFAHQKTCPLYELGKDADRLRQALDGVELFMSSDTVLDILSQKLMVVEPKILGVNATTTAHTFSYVVEWVYPGVTLRIERVTFDDDEYGEMSLYAVQGIKENNNG